MKDLSADGFARSEGRVDSLPDTTAAVLVYTRRQHVIDLFIWPISADKGSGGSGVRERHNIVHWQEDGKSFWAVADYNTKEFTDVTAKWS